MGEEKKHTKKISNGNSTNIKDVITNNIYTLYRLVLFIKEGIR